MKADLTLAEARDAVAALEREVGESAETYVSLNRGARYGSRNMLSAQLYPKGISGHTAHRIVVEADTFRELVDKLTEAWAEKSDLHAANTIREMALAIIAITADQGECTDAALRAKFDAADVKRFGEQACAQATEMASNGPFSIVTLTGANDVGEAA